MEIPDFTRDEDKDKINAMEWLRVVKKYDMNPSRENFYLFGEAQTCWRSMDKDTRWNLTWEEFEKFFLDKWIKDTKWRKCIEFEVN